MNIKNVYILEDRGILFVNGSDAKEFLPVSYTHLTLPTSDLV